ncbi:hypothetical protein [Dermatophilus congolensis]|uniref:hypothetical protein n=1 Tax=Dermatophilus congolensis TaxID=1863 RepID=UPI000E0EEFBA|nr:hypothetical protein [Dermatophilus congolensis]
MQHSHALKSPNNTEAAAHSLTTPSATKLVTRPTPAANNTPSRQRLLHSTTDTACAALAESRPWGRSSTP